MFPLVGKIRKEEGKEDLKGPLRAGGMLDLGGVGGSLTRYCCLSVGLCVWVGLMGRRVPV